MTCSATRFILLAWAVGLLAATLSGSDLVGWVAAAFAVAIAVGVGRLMPGRFGRSSCAVPRRAAERTSVDSPQVEPEHATS